MFKEDKVYKISLGILIGILALYLGKGFWTYFLFSFGTIISILVIPVMLGYLYLVTGLLRLKGWALGIFLTIILSAIFMESLFVVIGKEMCGDLLEGLFHMICIVSFVILPVFGISAVVRRMFRRFKERERK